jgi:hypothetical protein
MSGITGEGLHHSLGSAESCWSESFNLRVAQIDLHSDLAARLVLGRFERGDFDTNVSLGQ